MKIHVLPAGPIETNGYLLTESRLGAAVLVDAPEDVWAEVEPLLAQEGCRLQELWLTHGHWDHIQDAAKIKRATGATVRGHAADRDLFTQPELMRIFALPGIELEPVTIDAFFEHGQQLEVLGQRFEVRHVPGHCPGNVLIHSPALALAFVGDALFRGGIGRTDFPGGDFATLERSIRSQIYTLPDNTRVLPGHGPATSVGEEKESNPFVSASPRGERAHP